MEQTAVVLTRIKKAAKKSILLSLLAGCVYTILINIVNILVQRISENDVESLLSTASCIGYTVGVFIGLTIFKYYELKKKETDKKVGF